MAGDLLVREAGGIVTDFEGITIMFKAAISWPAPKVLKQMLAQLRKKPEATTKRYDKNDKGRQICRPFSFNEARFLQIDIKRRIDIGEPSRKGIFLLIVLFHATYAYLCVLSMIFTYFLKLF